MSLIGDECTKNVKQIFRFDHTRTRATLTLSGFAIGIGKVFETMPVRAIRCRFTFAGRRKCDKPYEITAHR